MKDFIKEVGKNTVMSYCIWTGAVAGYLTGLTVWNEGLKDVVEEKTHKIFKKK